MQSEYASKKQRKHKDAQELALFGVDVESRLRALDTLGVLDASDVLDDTRHRQNGGEVLRIRLALRLREGDTAQMATYVRRGKGYVDPE